MTRRTRTALAAHNEASQGKLRRLNLALQIPPIAGGGLVLVVFDAQVWWVTLVLLLGLLAGLVAVERWTADDLPRVMVPCLSVAAAVWVFGALVADASTAFYGISIVGSLVVPQLRRHRGAGALAVIGFVAATGATRLLIDQQDVPGDLVAYVLLPAGLTVLTTALMFGNQMFFELMRDARERESELAVARERIRFAGDLHDIQGHTLHVVKLKTTLAQKLVHRDPDRAEGELREIHALVADTITQTKALANGQRRLNLSAELENAKNLFEAAGIDVRITRDTEPDPRTSELLGQVLRETTTNILRHAQASWVRITLGGRGIEIVNDGAREGPLGELSGLSALRQRVADDGGALAVEQHDGRFRTAAAFGQPQAGTTAAAAPGPDADAGSGSGSDPVPTSATATATAMTTTRTTREGS